MLDRLEAFAAPGFTVQAPHAKAALGLAAALLLVGGMSAPTPPVTGASGRLADGAYARLVAEVQDAADTEVGFGRVTVLDRSSTAEAERARISERLPGQEAPARVQPAALRTAGATTFPLVAEGESYAMERRYGVPDGMTCLVVGADPKATNGEVIGGLMAPARDLGDLPASGVQRWMLMREVGRCIGARSDLAADTFAALMARRSPDAAGVPNAVVRELGYAFPAEAARMAHAFEAAAHIDVEDLTWEGAARAAGRIAAPIEAGLTAAPAVAPGPAQHEAHDGPEEADEQEAGLPTP